MREPVIMVFLHEDGGHVVGILTELSPSDFTTIVAQLVGVYAKEWLMGLPTGQLLENIAVEVNDG